MYIYIYIIHVSPGESRSMGHFLPADVLLTTMVEGKKITIINSQRRSVASRGEPTTWLTMSSVRLAPIDGRGDAIDIKLHACVD